MNPWRRMVVKLNYLLQMAFNQCSVPADGARDEAPRPRDHAPCGCDDRSRGAPNSNGGYLHGPYTWDDSSGEDHQDPTSGISCSNGSMPTQSRACKEDREQTRTISGMHSLRAGEEGLAGELRGPDHQRADPDLRPPARNSKSPRRNCDSSHAKHSSLFGKLGQVLFEIIATPPRWGTKAKNPEPGALGFSPQVAVGPVGCAPKTLHTGFKDLMKKPQAPVFIR